MRRMTRTRADIVVRAAPVIAGILLYGCGGAGGAASGLTNPVGGGGGSQTENLGGATVAFDGHPQPMLSGNSGGVSVLGQAGASYTNFTVIPTPNIASTYLLITRMLANAGSQLYTVPMNGSGMENLLVHASNNGFATVSTTGVIAYLTQVNGVYTLETIKPDGTQPHVVLSNVPAIPSISPNGTTIVYLDGNGNLNSIPAAGGTPKLIYSGGNVTGPAVWSPNGATIAFSAKNSSTTLDNVYTMPSAGGAITDVTPAAYATGSTDVTSWSPDGNTLAAVYRPKGSSAGGVLTISLNGGYSNVLTPTTYNDTWPCFSPDNKQIAFYRDSTGGATPGIYVSDFVGTNPQLVLSDPASNGQTGGIQTMSWSPFLQNQRFVGSGGTLSTANVSGFLMAQNGGQFASLLTFTATTSSTAKITPPSTPPNGGALIYTLGADSINNISFTNVYNGSHTSLNLTTTPTVVVSIDGGTGLVNLVAAAVKFNTSRDAGPHVTYTGQFTALYDGTGKNIAPGGATTIEVDRASGKLLSFH